MLSQHLDRNCLVLCYLQERSSNDIKKMAKIYVLDNSLFVSMRYYCSRNSPLIKTKYNNARRQDNNSEAVVLDQGA